MEDSFTLPALQMNHNDGFKLAVLLESPAPNRKPDPLEIEGSILSGRFVPYNQHPRRTRRVVIVAGDPGRRLRAQPRQRTERPLHLPGH